MKKTIALCIAAIIMAIALPAPVYASDVNVTIDGRQVVFPAQHPVIVDDRTLVPVRGVFDSLGFELAWNEAARQATLTNARYVIVLTIGSSEFTTNGVVGHLDVPAQIIGDSTMIPLGAVLRSVGFELEWDDSARTVQINANNQAPAGFAMEVPAVPHQAGPPAIPATAFAGTGLHGAMVSGVYAQFNLPSSLAGMPCGEIIVADTSNNAIRLVDADGNVRLFAGTIDIAGRDNFPFGFYLDAGLAESGFNRPVGIAVCDEGRVFIIDSQNHSIRIAVDGVVRTFSGGNGMGFADGGPDVARFNNPSAMAICPQGNLIVADTLNHVIRRIDAMGVVTTIAGRAGVYGNADGNANRATFDSPMGVVVCQSGRVYVADTGNHLIRVIENGVVSTLAGSVQRMAQALRDGHPDRWDMNPLGGFEDGVGNQALFNKPMGLALWNGNLVIADSANHSIRILAPSGEVATIAGTGIPGFAEQGGVAFHLPRGLYVRGDYLYVADTGNNMIRRIRLSE